MEDLVNSIFFFYLHPLTHSLNIILNLKTSKELNLSHFLSFSPHFQPFSPSSPLTSPSLPLTVASGDIDLGPSGEC